MEGLLIIGFVSAGLGAGTWISRIVAIRLCETLAAANARQADGATQPGP